MRHAYLWTPAALTLVFFGYYTMWEARAAERVEEIRDGMIKAWADSRYIGRDGKKEAEADIAKGKPTFKLYGKSSNNREEEIVIYARFGVNEEIIAGCCVSEELVEFASAYNRTVEAFIAKKYGRYALDAARVEALRKMRLRMQ